MKWLKDLFTSEREAVQNLQDIPTWQKDIEGWSVKRTEVGFGVDRSYLITSPEGQSMQIPGIVLEHAVAELSRAQQIYWLERAEPFEILNGRCR